MGVNFPCPDCGTRVRAEPRVKACRDSTRTRKKKQGGGAIKTSALRCNCAVLSVSVCATTSHIGSHGLILTGRKVVIVLPIIGVVIAIVIFAIIATLITLAVVASLALSFVSRALISCVVVQFRGFSYNAGFLTTNHNGDRDALKPKNQPGPTS